MSSPDIWCGDIDLMELNRMEVREVSLISQTVLQLFIHSIGMCRMCRFFAILRSLIHSSLLCTLSFHPFPLTSLPSSLTSSCHLFLGLALSLFVSKFIYSTFWEFCFLPFSVHAQTNTIYLTLLSLL